MLCTIDPDVGGHANDQKSRHYNVMASIHAIATAAAGATPVNNPVNSSGTRNNSHNCITVISNTEAGGWLASTSNHYTSSSTFTASAASQWLDLYKETGKTTYPYYRVAFGTVDYPFNSSFTSYPGVRWHAGCTTDNPTSVAIESSNANYFQRPRDNQYTSGATAVAEGVGATTTNHRARFDESGRTYTVAITANYIIISTPDYLFYFGIRTVGGWELSRTDNPPWVVMAYTRRENSAGLTGSASSVQYNHTEHVAAWAATINSAGTQVGTGVTTGIFGGRVYNSTQQCQMTGFNGWSQMNSYATQTYHSNRILRNPLFQSPLNSNWGQYINNSSYYYYSDGVVADTATGLSVPPVYPVVFNCCNMESSAYAIGTAPGILKGMHGTTAMTDYFVTGSSYTIGGETYVPVRTGNTSYKDLWFLRAA
jgi:hypothetical protein